MNVQWLKRGVKIISRDRAGAYAEAATRGAPRAWQVADRYQVLVNLRDAIKGTLARKSGSLPEVAAERGEPRASSQPAMAPFEASRAPDETASEDERAGVPQDQRPAAACPLTEASQRRQISRANSLARYEQIIALHRQGLSQRALARQLHVSRKVVHRWVRAGTFPERASTGKRETQTRCLLALPAKALGRRLSQRPAARA
jgi:transposase